jgi:hypothetical protein
MTDPTYPMTNAELAAAIEWASQRFAGSDIGGMERDIMREHLEGLLKTQRQRADIMMGQAAPDDRPWWRK